MLFYRCQPVQHGKLLSCRDERVRYTAPVYLRHENGLLLVVPNSADPRNTQPRWFDTAYSIRIVDRSSSRGLVMAGTAVATFALVGLGASYLASQFSNDPHGYQPLFLGLFVGGGAGGASLLITGPLTRDLGTPVR